MSVACLSAPPPLNDLQCHCLAHESQLSEARMFFVSAFWIFINSPEKSKSFKSRTQPQEFRWLRKFRFHLRTVSFSRINNDQNLKEVSLCVHRRAKLSPWCQLPLCWVRPIHTKASAGRLRTLKIRDLKKVTQVRNGSLLSLPAAALHIQSSSSSTFLLSDFRSGEKFGFSETCALKYKKPRSLSNPMAVTGTARELALFLR